MNFQIRAHQPFIRGNFVTCPNKCPNEFYFSKLMGHFFRIMSLFTPYKLQTDNIAVIMKNAKKQEKQEKQEFASKLLKKRRIKKKEQSRQSRTAGKPGLQTIYIVLVVEHSILMSIYIYTKLFHINLQKHLICITSMSCANLESIK